ncbi:AMP-binding protein [Homoserinimonas sp. OAct 916]|uniref:AMP-binding protein n=1 Tax=Homoserinimonas sp. OAct 916 TaxID=2211450 RepID=UPI000DBE8D58|nr:AMP-binding protein [Homoserinimonas sp. OAct 916]
MSRPLRLLAADDPRDVLHGLRDALSGVGPAIWPVAPGARLPEQVPERVAPDVVLIVETSGSTGNPKRVVLTADALLASATASEAALGGPGQWLLALPAHYIAGINVLVRSLTAGTEPEIAGTGHFDPDDVVAAARRMAGTRRYVSLVPAQLAALLDADAAGDLLRRFDRILVGGQALPTRLRERADEMELRITRTYGSSETGGGCVYDGRPIGDTRVRIVDGLIELAGTVLAVGYLDPGQTDRAFHNDEGLRWYRSQDTGQLSSDEHGPLLTVTGRADDVIISGGVKVSLAEVEHLLQAVPEFAHSAVTGAPSDRWGEVPVLVLEGTDPPPGASESEDTGVGDHEAILERARHLVGEQLGPAARPDRLVIVSAIPRLPSGKLDRVALRALTTDQATPSG